LARIFIPPPRIKAWRQDMDYTRNYVDIMARLLEVEFSVDSPLVAWVILRHTKDKKYMGFHLCAWRNEFYAYINNN